MVLLKVIKKSSKYFTLTLNLDGVTVKLKDLKREKKSREMKKKFLIAKVKIIRCMFDISATSKINLSINIILTTILPISS